MSYTFKPGDRVQYGISSTFGTVRMNIRNKLCEVDWDYGQRQRVSCCVLTLIPEPSAPKFEVGDVVRYLPKGRNRNPCLIGATGKIETLDTKGKASRHWANVRFRYAGPCEVVELDDLQPVITQVHPEDCHCDDCRPLYPFDEEEGGEKLFLDELNAPYANLFAQQAMNQMLQGLPIFPPTERRNLADFITEYNNPESQAMSTKPIKVESKIFVNGAEISVYDDDLLFQLIAQSEAEIARLSALKHQPKALVKRLEELNAGIQKLVEYMDSRG
jgi:hypothetical protein